MAVCRVCEKDLVKKTKCVFCGAWNAVPSSKLHSTGDDGTVLIEDVADKDAKVYRTGPWDKNFSDPHGVPDDAVILIGGEPGVGKSTLALQLCDALARSQKRETLYIPAEENDTQVKVRALRLRLPSIGKRYLRFISRNKIAHVSIRETVDKYRPCGVIVDSMPGFTDDLNEAIQICQMFTEIAKDTRTPFLVIDHITKAGDLAGLMTLQHHVDITCLATKTPKDEIVPVYYTEDEDKEVFEIEEMRELYTKKSRYGPAGSEVTTRYHMTERGLIQVELAEDDGEGEDE